MTLAWVVSARIKNAGIVDICRELCFVLQAWIYFALTPEGFIGLSLPGVPAELRAGALLADEFVNFSIDTGRAFGLY